MCTTRPLQGSHLLVYDSDKSETSIRQSVSAIYLYASLLRNSRVSSSALRAPGAVSLNAECRMLTAENPHAAFLREIR